MALNFPSQGRDLHIQMHEAHRAPNLTQKKNSVKYITVKLSTIKSKDFRRSKRREAYNLRKNLHKIKSCFLKRNFTGQERVGRYIQIAQKTEPNPKSANQEYPIYHNCPS